MRRAITLLWLAMAACSKESPAEDRSPAVALPAQAPPCLEDTQGRDVDLGPNKAVAIAAAGARACAVVDDGSVMCWGNDAPEHVGEMPYAKRAAHPERIRGLTDVVEIALGEYAGCARRAGAARRP